jgi:hypothetical protein
MNKRKFAGVLIAAAMIALPMASARADCAADIEKTRKSLDLSNIAFTGTRDAVQRFLDLARQKLEDGKKKGCNKMVTKAKQIIAANNSN